MVATGLPFKVTGPGPTLSSEALDLQMCSGINGFWGGIGLPCPLILPDPSWAWNELDLRTL